MVPICTWVSVMTEQGIGKPFRTVISPNESPGESLPIITDLTRCSWSRYIRDKAFEKENPMWKKPATATSGSLKAPLRRKIEWKRGRSWLRGIILLIFGTCQVFKGHFYPQDPSPVPSKNLLHAWIPYWKTVKQVGSKSKHMMTFDDTPGIVVLSRPNLLSPKAHVRHRQEKDFFKSSLWRCLLILIKVLIQYEANC